MKRANEELGKEVLVLQAGTQKTCHDLSAAATEKGMVFAEKWRAMSTVRSLVRLIISSALFFWLFVCS